jgi:transposase
MEWRVKLKVVLDIIENELSYSQAARKYDMYLSSGSLNDTLPARWVYQYRIYGKERFFQTPKDYQRIQLGSFINHRKRWNRIWNSKSSIWKWSLNIQKNYSLSSKTGTNKQKYQVVKELRRKYALKDLLKISGLPKSVY